MSGFSDGFQIGLMNKLDENISARHKKGEDYFDRQLELARTKGIETRAQSQKLQQQGLSQAKQLMQLGVPKDIVMSIASQNPADLGSFASTVQEMQTEAGSDGLDEEFYRELFNISGEIDSGETLEQLFSRIYTPLANNIKADPDTFKSNKKATILASIMGYNAQSEAMDRLEDTEVVDGLSAADLLRYNGEPNLGDTTVTLDAGRAGDAIRDIRAARKNAEDKPITRSDRTAIAKDFEDSQERHKLQYSAEIEAAGKDEDEFDPDVIKRRAARDLSGIYPRDMLEQIDSIRRWLPPEDDDRTAPPSPTSPEGLGEPEITPEAEVGLSEDKKVTIRGHTLVKDNFNGTSIWVDSQGKQHLVNNSTTPSYLGLSKTPQNLAPGSAPEGMPQLRKDGA